MKKIQLQEQENLLNKLNEVKNEIMKSTRELKILQMENIIL